MLIVGLLDDQAGVYDPAGKICVGQPGKDVGKPFSKKDDGAMM
jgi:hypothetical protein